MLTEHGSPPAAYAVRWAGGFVLATALAAAISAPFTDSVMPYVRDEAVKVLVPAPGHVHHNRSEGWGDSRFGRHGIVGLDDPAGLSGPSVALWGDSYVEALQVDDDEKVAALLPETCRRKAGRPVTGVAIGQSGRHVADYVHLIPRYEALFAPEVHYVVIPHLGDVVPDGRRFLDDPPRLVEGAGDTPPGDPRVRALVERLHLQFAWRAARNAWYGANGNRRLRFRPGPVDLRLPVNKYDEAVTLPSEATTGFLLDALDAATERPIVFVYTPAVPRIRDDRVDLEDPSAEAALRFAALAARRGMGFLDLGAAFREAWRTRGELSRGFHNGFPGGGHWNTLGHRLVAEAICADLAAR